jgi:hypothetical protein
VFSNFEQTSNEIAQKRDQGCSKTTLWLKSNFSGLCADYFKTTCPSNQPQRRQSQSFRSGVLGSHENLSSKSTGYRFDMNLSFNTSRRNRSTAMLLRGLAPSCSNQTVFTAMHNPCRWTLTEVTHLWVQRASLEFSEDQNLTHRLLMQPPKWRVLRNFVFVCAKFVSFEDVTVSMFWFKKPFSRSTQFLINSYISCTLRGMCIKRNDVLQSEKYVHFDLSTLDF